MDIFSGAELFVEGLLRTNVFPCRTRTVKTPCGCTVLLRYDAVTLPKTPPIYIYLSVSAAKNRTLLRWKKSGGNFDQFRHTGGFHCINFLKIRPRSDWSLKLAAPELPLTTSYGSPSHKKTFLSIENQILDGSFTGLPGAVIIFFFF